MTHAYQIRRPRSPIEYARLQDVQRGAWGLTDDSYVVPVATLIGADRHGGIVLGAFLPDGTAAGFSFAFLGRVRGELGLYSQLTAVSPGWQGQGIGRQLKEQQRALARVQQLNLIAWAFDPLQAGNAHFNLTTLGAVAHEFIPDMYGPRTDPLNQSVPTDRLIVAWETGPTVRKPRPAASAIELIDCRAGVPRLACDPPENAHALAIALPRQIQALRRHEPSKAQAWQSTVREAFQAAFARGYAATRFVKSDSHDWAGHYVLERTADQRSREPILMSGPDNRDDLRRA